MDLYECITEVADKILAAVVLSVAIWSLFRYVIGKK